MCEGVGSGRLRSYHSTPITTSAVLTPKMRKLRLEIKLVLLKQFQQFMRGQHRVYFHELVDLHLLANLVATALRPLNSHINFGAHSF